MNKDTNGGIGFWGLLQLMFILLKLLGVIKWSWVLVFIPTYIAIFFCIAALIILMIILK